VVKELRSADPASVGPYRLLGRLGAGGMGQVYLARSRGGRLVAIKVIRPELADERGFRARFASEIAAAKNVSGVYTAAVIDSDPEAETPWMATAYVPGPCLADAVEDEGPLPVTTVLALAAGLAEALVAIHQAGVVHRDLKPSNVLLAADGPRVIDFGISLAVERSMLTTTGVVMGSPGYMSPEQARGQREVGPPTDVFSLGAVLAFALTGDGPFGGGSTPALLYRVVNEEPDLARVPAQVRPLVEQCLAKDPAGRPAPARILELLGGEAGPRGEEWLPRALADTIGRYSPTAGVPVPSLSSATEPPDPAGAGVLASSGPASETGQPGDPGDITHDVPVPGGAEPAPPPASLASPSPSSPPGPPSPSPPAAKGGPGRRRRLTVSAAAVAVIVAAVVAAVVAAEPGGTPRTASGPAPSLVRVTQRPSAAPTTSARRFRTRTPTRTRKAVAKPARTVTRASQSPTSPTPTPGYAASPTPTPTPAGTPPVTPATASRTPSQAQTSQAASGVQAITGYSGATSPGCAAYGSIGSGSGGSRVGYSFTNNSSAAVQLWFITASGSGAPEGTVASGGSLSPSVTTGQDWMVTDAGGGCLGLFTITGDGNVTVGS
jgi:serine/threonine protein kinase